jgi:uncharacterized protein (DUF3084 family)
MSQVLVLLLVSAIIAYLGDVLGTQVGKKRLSLFGLRPRVTAVVVSISTGMIITLLTLMTAALLSDNVKIALFSVEQLNEERDKLGKEVKGLEKERTQLQSDVTSLMNTVRIKEQGLVVFRKDTPLAAIVVEGKQTPEVLLASLTHFIGELSRKAVERGLKSKAKETMISENLEELRKMAQQIAESDEQLVIAAVADENKMLGEELGQVRFLVSANTLIFKAGEEIAALPIDGSLERRDIARTLKEFMDEINYEVVKQGMIGDPLTGRFGDLSSDSMLSFYDMVNQIKLLGRKITLVAVVQEDTFAIGPLNVSFRLEEG